MIDFEKSCGNVFLDIGFTKAEAAEMTAKGELIAAIMDAIAQRKLNIRKAAAICRTDQRTLAKVLRCSVDGITIAQLSSWRAALSRE